MLLSLLFWNMGRADLVTSIARLAHDHDVRVLVLAECIGDLTELARHLAETTRHTWHIVSGPATTTAGRRLPMLTSLPDGSITPVRESVTNERHRIFRVRIPFALDFLPAAAHLPSKLHRRAYDLAGAARSLARAIDATEAESDHQRTILLGDLNMSPFEPGVVAADSLHAVMTEKIARQGSRRVGPELHRFFYNPMWGLFGDRTPGPPGSYYYRGGRQVEYFWHLFDQALLRPDLIDALRGVQILDTCGGTSLLTSNGLPQRSLGSDHLPLHVQLDFSGGRTHGVELP